MSRSSLLALFASAAVLSACSTVNEPGIVQKSEVPSVSRNGQFDFTLASGKYNCEHGLSVHLEREVRDRVNSRIQLGWKGGRYQLERDPSHSGLPRFEDSASGLVWIDLPWKGLLLDGRTHKPLANECRAA
ncbi:hypothetical protein CJ010_24100 [Azoarcus sp. DD4]|uniref:hypothetical protein n=1 Tax=Azoarcus sp. DD4 TaxID=2027405 RepID=UPI001126A67C|nr:hypothetical protein [Azoarcus sp. DD4]QDF99887.1 hypothetical protein CJ010_24100 [Azoarcus sp. DD4]